MRINRTYALAASAWLVLVVVGAVLVWAVISRAGQSVVTDPGAPIGETAPVSPPPQSQRTDRPDPPKPTKKKRPSAPASSSPNGPTAGPSAPGSPSSTPNPGPPPPSATSGGGGPGPTSGPGPGPSSPSNPPPSSSPPPPQSTQSPAVRRTWQGSAGAVTVECRGQSISLQGAQPNSGWSIDINERGPEEVRIDFESNDGDRRTRVQAQCVGGSPRFDVDQDD